jgi:type VI secretion system protein ImpB
MAEDTTVAPIDRVNIKYKSKTDAGEDVEIPFKLMVVGDFSMRPNDTPLEARKATGIDKSNFDAVMKEKGLSVEVTVPDHLSGAADAQIQAKLKIEGMKDFSPDALVEQVPELKQRIGLREALKEIKADLANPTKLRKLREKIDEVLKDEETKKKLLDIRPVKEH